MTEKVDRWGKPKHILGMLSTAKLCGQVRDLLNDPDPEEYLEQLGRSGDTQDPLLRRRLEALKKILAEARAHMVPLGVDPGEHSSLENAYLYRQRYIERVCQRIDFRHTAIMLIALLALGIVFILSAMAL